MGNALDTLSKQIIQDIEDKKSLSNSLLELDKNLGTTIKEENNEYCEDIVGFLERFGKSHINKNFEIFNSTLDICCGEYPDIFNSKIDNIVGYFLRKEDNKFNVCIRDISNSNSCISLERATQLHERYTINNAQDLETYTQFYPLRELFSFPNFWSPDKGIVELQKCWKLLDKKYKICIKCL